MRRMADRLDIGQRKRDHLALCAGDKVAFRGKSTLLEEVEFVHCALPELHADEIDARVDFFGKTLNAPIFVAAMTGGTDEAAAINQDLAQVAESLGLGFGLGSQRAMHERPEIAWTFKVREQAPEVLLLGNLGLVQAREMSTAQIEALCDEVGADALCIHLNPAMEIVQPGGDRDFRGGAPLFRRLTQELSRPVIAKETGCGISRAVALTLRGAGVEHLDLSGSGGTSWVAVEAHRSTDAQQSLAQTLWDWGIPTGASLMQIRGLKMNAIATGGMRGGLCVARAIALGASAAGLAAPVLKAYRQGGKEEATRFLQEIIDTLKSVMLLTGAKTIPQLQQLPLICGPKLQAWAP